MMPISSSSSSLILTLDEARAARRRQQPSAVALSALLGTALFLSLSFQPIAAATVPSQEMPVLFEQTASNVSGYEGQTVYLPCRVHNLGDKVVSWMRSRDLHILSSGKWSFSSDPRFQLQHLEGSDAWTLRLDHLRRSDQGAYECQVNSEPKIMYAVQLTVLEAEQPFSQQSRTSYESTAPLAAILGPRQLQARSGSTVSLRCLVSSPYQTRPLRGLHWLRDGKPLAAQASGAAVHVETLSGLAQSFSQATLSNVAPEDSGRYSCRPADGKPDSVLLQVRADDSAEAMQHDAASTSSAGRRLCAIEIPLLLLLSTGGIFQ